jgi:hypothetical protein
VTTLPRKVAQFLGHTNKWETCSPRKITSDLSEVSPDRRRANDENVMGHDVTRRVEGWEVQLLEFIHGLGRQIRCKVRLIWDGLPAHRSQFVRD